MLGWWIAIKNLSPEEMDQPLNDETTVLACWEVGVSGIRWLEQLVRQGKAQQLNKGGYPNRWQAPAGVILPLLAEESITAQNKGPSILNGLDENEAYVSLFHRLAKITQHADRIAACTPEQLLTIDAWDLS